MRACYSHLMTPPKTATAAQPDEDAVVFEGSAEDAIRMLEGEHADETIEALRAEGLLCDSSD